jgi:zinc protease
MLGLLAPAIVAVVAGRSTAPPKIETHTLASGLTILVVENHATPLVTVEIGVKNGSMTESPEYNGLSHLYEHMFFKANAVLPSQGAYLARAQELGILWNGTTNTERVNYFFTTTSDHTADAMVFMRDAIVSPLFDAKELERERVVVTGELDRNEATPEYHFWHTIEKRIWWKYPSYKDPLGSRQTVLHATRAQMQTIQRRYYVPNNSVLVVTGDVSAQPIFAQAEQLYAGWKRADDPFHKYPLVRHPAIPKTEVVVVEQPVKTVSGQLVWHGPSTVGPSVRDTYAADAFGAALAHPASRFQKALVDSGACVSASLGWYTQMNTGPITLAFESTPERADDCVRAVLAEVARLADGNYTSEADLQRGAHTLEVGVVHDSERPSQLAHTLTFWWTSAGLDYYLGYVDKLYAVTPTDVDHYLRTYIVGQPYVFGALVAPEMKLDNKHFEKLIGVAP